MIEFRLTLYIAVLMIALAVLANTVPLFYRVQPVLQWELSLSARHLAQITVFLLTVLTIACLFPGVAAISIGARSGLGRSIALALRNMPSLYAIYFLGLFPWMLLDTIGSEFLVFSISADIMGPERPLIIKSIIVGFFYTVAIVLSASAYRTMLHKSEARAAAAFD